MGKKLCMVVFGLLVTASVSGQAPTGSVIGTVTDPTGAVVPKARVELRNKQTGFRRVVETTAMGEYSTPAMPPGNYDITVQAPGLQGVNREVVVEAGVATTLNITVALEGAEAIVKVSAVTPQIRYDQFDIGGVVTQGQVERLHAAALMPDGSVLVLGGGTGIVELYVENVPPASSN